MLKTEVITLRYFPFYFLYFASLNQYLAMEWVPVTSTPIYWPEKHSQ
jgi:hypothetical protein